MRVREEVKEVKKRADREAHTHTIGSRRCDECATERSERVCTRGQAGRERGAEEGEDFHIPLTCASGEKEENSSTRPSPPYRRDNGERERYISSLSSLLLIYLLI